MGMSKRLCSLVIWCFVLSIKNVHAQGYFYKSSNVNQYQIVNGKYELVTTTTPAPTVLETIFPWAGKAYGSSKTPEEDAAIMASLTDMEAAASDAGTPATESEGFFSWFRIPGFGSSSSETTEEKPAEQPGSVMGGPMNPMGYPPPGPVGPSTPDLMGGLPPYPPHSPMNPPPSGSPTNLMGGPSPEMMGFPPMGPMSGPPPEMMGNPHMGPMSGSPPEMMGNPHMGPMSGPPPEMMGNPGFMEGMNFYDNYDMNSINFQPMMASASQPEPMMLPPPPSPNSAYPSYAPQPRQSPPPNMNAIPHEIQTNLHPTFQFHQNVMDSIPIPSPSISQSSPNLPYAYAASFQYGTKGAINERPLSPSFIEAISSFFNIGKRSDLDKEVLGVENREGNKAIKSRSSDISEEVYVSDENDTEGQEWDSIDMSAFEDSDNKVKSSDDETQGEVGQEDAVGVKPSEKDFPCPKSGIWKWNGDVCVAVGPVPIWACRPNDLVVSGKIAICRNKIYFSPKVINKNLTLQQRRLAAV